MKRSLLYLLVLAISPVLLHANGDPVPPKVSDVQVYGFPVDFDGRMDDAPGFSGDEGSASLSEVGVAGTRYKDLCLSDLVVLDGFVDLSEK